MIDPNITARERLCIRILAGLFEKGVNWVNTPLEHLKEGGLELEPLEYPALMRMMESYGVIAEPIHSTGGQFGGFTITANSVLVAREMDALERKEQEPEDIVGQVNQQVRKHPVAAWCVIGFIVLTAVLTFVSQILNILNTLGWLPAKHP